VLYWPQRDLICYLDLHNVGNSTAVNMQGSVSSYPLSQPFSYKHAHPSLRGSCIRSSSRLSIFTD